MASQATGLAEAVGFAYQIKTIQLRRPWRWLPGHLCPGVLQGLSQDSDSLKPPWPDLLITCGRRSVAAALAIKQRSAGRTTTVHIQNPRIPARHLDLVVPMEHDRIAGPNVRPTKVALHRVTPQKLAEASERFRNRFAHLPRPWVGVLIGGSNSCYSLTPSSMIQVGQELAQLAHRHGAGLLVSTSRRTGAENEVILREQLQGVASQIWDGRGENPYLGILALAEHILVTCDSVSMISEACATGKPVHILQLSGGSPRFQRFHEQLQKAGVVRRYRGELSTWVYEPLNDTLRIAETVRKLVDRRRHEAMNSSAPIPSVQEALS